MNINFIQKAYKKPLVFLSCINLSCIFGLLASNIALYMGLQACAMCSIQRFMIFGIAILSSLAISSYGLGLSRKLSIFLIKLVCIFVFSSFSFSVYQALVERKVIQLPSICKYSIVSDAQKNINMEDFIFNTKLAPCDRPTYIIGKISIADIAFVGTLLMLILTIIFTIYQSNVNRNRISSSA